MSDTFTPVRPALARCAVPVRVRTNGTPAQPGAFEGRAPGKDRSRPRAAPSAGVTGMTWGHAGAAPDAHTRGGVSCEE